MKITMRNEPKEVNFSSIGTGELFMQNGVVFMKLETILYLIGGRLGEMLLEGNADCEDLEEVNVNALNMGSGMTTYFEKTDKVILIKDAELIVNN